MMRPHRAALLAPLLLAARPVRAQEAGHAIPAPIATLLPHDTSITGMFAHADTVVKGVMIGLVVASVITWTVLLAKAIEIGAARRGLAHALREAEAEPTLPGLRRRLASGTAAPLADAAFAELDLSAGATSDGIRDRVGSRLSRTEAAIGRRLARGTGILATIGSTAPFVGLFGTVWGIMNSFIGIANSGTTSLAVVAPGIAEALLATATGLVAAIPAVVIYNLFARQISHARALAGDVSAAVLRTIGRELETRRPTLAQAAE